MGPTGRRHRQTCTDCHRRGSATDFDLVSLCRHRMITASHSWPLPGRIEAPPTPNASSGSSTGSSLTSVDDHHLTAIATMGETTLNTPPACGRSVCLMFRSPSSELPQTLWHQHRDSFTGLWECVPCNPADECLVRYTHASLTKWAQSQLTTPKSSRTNRACMSWPILIGIATPSWRST